MIFTLHTVCVSQRVRLVHMQWCIVQNHDQRSASRQGGAGTGQGRTVAGQWQGSGRAEAGQERAGRAKQGRAGAGRGEAGQDEAGQGRGRSRSWAGQGRMRQGRPRASSVKLQKRRKESPGKLCKGICQHKHARCKAELQASGNCGNTRKAFPNLSCYTWYVPGNVQTDNIIINGNQDPTEHVDYPGAFWQHS